MEEGSGAATNEDQLADAVAKPELRVADNKNERLDTLPKTDGFEKEEKGMINVPFEAVNKLTELVEEPFAVTNKENALAEADPTSNPSR
jgi:hypothetical protein